MEFAEIAFWARKLAVLLILPPVGPLIVAFAGIAIMGGWPKLGRGLAAVGASLLLLLSIPVVAQSLQLALYSDGPIDLAQARDAGAIVIIGGGVRQGALEYGGDTLGRLTLERVRYGARLARQTGLPILVSGGAVFDTAAEADLMAGALNEEYQLEVRWRESRSRNTRENAQNTGRVLRGVGVECIVLVTHGFDVPRARAEFEAAGLKVRPAPTFLAEPVTLATAGVIPSLGALQSSYFACYELLAIFARWLGIP